MSAGCLPASPPGFRGRPLQKSKMERKHRQRCPCLRACFGRPVSSGSSSRSLPTWPPSSAYRKTLGASQERCPLLGAPLPLYGIRALARRSPTEPSQALSFELPLTIQRPHPPFAPSPVLNSLLPSATFPLDGHPGRQPPTILSGPHVGRPIASSRGGTKPTNPHPAPTQPVVVEFPRQGHAAVAGPKPTNGSRALAYFRRQTIRYASAGRPPFERPSGLFFEIAELVTWLAKICPILAFRTGCQRSEIDHGGDPSGFFPPVGHGDPAAHPI